MPHYYQGKDGRWRVRYRLPKDPKTGKYRQVRAKITFKTKRQAESWWAQKRVELDRQRGIAPAELTLAEYAEQWYTAHSARVREATAFGYRRILDRYILPYLGSYQLQTLHATIIEAWHAQVRDELGIGLSTLHRAHGTLSQILRHAQRRGIVSDNPASLVWPQAPERGGRRSWDLAQIQTFLAACNAPEYLVFRMALLTGLRRGELLALEWSDLDLKAGTLTVQRTQTRTRDGEWVTGPPKTPRSRRTLAMPRSLVLALRQHRSAQYQKRLEYPGWWGHDLVFCHDDGRPFAPSSLLQTLRRLCDDLGIPRTTIHGLRRNAATLLVALGTHPRVIQQRLGHESIDMSMNLYAEAAGELDQRVADDLDRALDRFLDSDGIDAAAE